MPLPLPDTFTFFNAMRKNESYNAKCDNERCEMYNNPEHNTEKEFPLDKDGFKCKPLLYMH